MKKLLATLAIVLGLVGTANAEPLTRPEAAELLQGATVELRHGLNLNPFCTATKIGDKKYLTALHCVSRLSTEYSVYYAGEGRAKVKAILAPTIHKKDLDHNKRARDDWAILYTDKLLSGVSALPLACSEEPYLGQAVAYYGHGIPLDGGFFTGYVSSVNKARKPSRQAFDFAIDTQVSGGASGSALMSMDTGHIMGVITEIVWSDRGTTAATGIEDITDFAVCDEDFTNINITININEEKEESREVVNGEDFKPLIYDKSMFGVK